MTTSATLQALAAAPTPDARLRALKDLKNSVIGNTWKKVEHAGDDALLRFLLDLLVVPADGDTIGADVVAETAVILGTLSSAGSLTLRPLLAEQVPSRLLALVRELPPRFPAAGRILPPLLRALRNVLGATADAVWGHMWGVGAEQKVVGTGLVGDDVLLPARVRGKELSVAAQWRADASAALVLVFEPANRVALLTLIDVYPSPSVLLPLYQLLARLIALPSHREALGLYPPGETPGAAPFLLQRLLEAVLDWWAPGRRPNPKLLEAVLDLLAALVKGQPTIASIVRYWPGAALGRESEAESTPDLVPVLVQLLETGPPNVRIAVAGCVTNILKADKGTQGRDRVNVNLTNLSLLSVIAKLLRSEAVEERVKLCFVLAALVSDDERLQKAAAEQGCPAQLLSMLVEVDADESRGELGHDAAARSREGILLALAALAFQHEANRSLVADANPPVLPLVRAALADPSYGVRAAACQLARALSRTVAIVRTSLVDSGVGAEVVETLRREVARRQAEEGDGPIEDDGMDVTAEQELGDRRWTVEVAATATICNLVTDFSPLKGQLLRIGGIQLLADLTTCTYEPLAENALWALKNLTYHAPEALKAEVMSALTWPTLQGFLSDSSPLRLRAQALAIVQNLVDDQTPTQLARTLDSLGAEETLDVLQTCAGAAADPSLREPALYVLSHLALGSETLRSALTARVAVLEALSAALDARADCVRVPALRTLRHLVESNTRSHKPRQAVVELLQPYHLKSRVRGLVENAGSVGVQSGAVPLLELLERARGA